MEYIGYADANAFVKISGISKDDLEKKSTRTKSFKRMHVQIWSRTKALYKN
ncbi:hypothetical protein UM562_06755 [Staphylococcus aureus]|nr:hypothetical protein UM707_01060 [Staphylococcus aureus]WRN48396.1 hypothetical protein UM562_06755 [Staphylococcus aureus]